MSRKKSGDLTEGGANYILALKYEKRTGIPVVSTETKSTRWGIDNESIAIQWLSDRIIGSVKSCSADFDEIIFNEPFTGFGDSPDFHIYDFNGKKVSVGEVKSPASQAKLQRYWSEVELDEANEYYWQIIGHFIGDEAINECYLLIYDGYLHDGKLFRFVRSDHEHNIQRATEMIKNIYYTIDEANV